MRGDIGAGREIGGGLGSVSQSYASGVSTSYDEARQVYVGEMTSRGGVYRVEGPDMASISMQIDDILRIEYQEMIRELATQRQREFGSDIGGWLMINGAPANVTHQRESGIPIMTLSSRGHHERSGISASGMLDITEIALTVFHAMHGQWLNALTSAISMIFEDYLSKFGGNKKKPLFGVMFGGILITASTRALLKKKLQLQKNRRIQLIMNHMREHEKNRNEATGTIGNDISGRLLEKREEAQRKWRNQISPQGQLTGWRERSLELKLGISKSRERAHALWTQRC